MVTSKNLSHTHYHIKGFFTEKAKGSPMLKGPGENMVPVQACVVTHIA